MMKTVKAGREVVLTERGKAFAVIRPLPREQDAAALSRRLAAEGCLRPALKKGTMAPWKPLRIRGKAASETLRADRSRY